MQRYHFFLSLFFLASAFSWAQNPEHFLADQLSSRAIEQHVYVLTSPEFEGRNNGTPGNAAARQYLIQQMEEYGIAPARAEGYEMPFSYLGTRGVNVFGWIPGSDPQLSKEYVLLSAHYDHLGIKQGVMYPGANDNACGCAVVLDISRVLSKNRSLLKRNVLISFFDAEEDIMKGSLYYVANPIVPLSQLACVLDMDLIGRPLLDRFPQKFMVFGTEYSPVLRELASSVKSSTSLEVQLSGTDLIGPRCDYFSFWIHQCPFIFLTRGQQKAYHQPYDIPETIDYSGLYQAARFAISLAEKLTQHPERPQYGKAHYHIDEVKGVLEMVQELKQAEGQSEWIQRFLQLGEGELKKMIRSNKIRNRDRWLLRGLTAMLLTESYRQGLQKEAPKIGPSFEMLENAIDRELDQFLEEQGGFDNSVREEGDEEATDNIQDLIKQFEDAVDLSESEESK
ncbi:MAG: M28 family peptidase [Planctomycetota bacterium]